MNVSELLELTNWVSIEIVQRKIPHKYQLLFTVLQNNARPNQPAQPFESQKDELINTLRAMPISKLTKDQLLFLDKLGIAGAVGEIGMILLICLWVKPSTGTKPILPWSSTPSPKSRS